MKQQARDRINKLATLSLIMIIALVGILSSMYDEYMYTTKDKERIQASHEISHQMLTKTIYRSLKRESNRKLDRITGEIRKDIIDAYGEDNEQFIYDYDHPSEDSKLMKILDTRINNPNARFLYIENDANDMFAASTRGMLCDKSKSGTVYGSNRSYEDESKLHFDKHITKAAIDHLKNGTNNNIFWRIDNGDKEVLSEMNIDELLQKNLKTIGDYEFLTVAYIDRHADILQVEEVTASGVEQNSRKIMIAQGFNLEDQISLYFKEEFNVINNDLYLQLELIEQKQNHIAIKMVLMTLFIIICMYSIGSVHNNYVRGECVK